MLHKIICEVKMLVKIQEGTWCKFYNQNGTNTTCISSDCYGMIIEEVIDERNQLVCTVLVGDELFEIPKEEVCQC